MYVARLNMELGVKLNTNTNMMTDSQPRSTSGFTDICKRPTQNVGSGMDEYLCLPQLLAKETLAICKIKYQSFNISKP